MYKPLGDLLILQVEVEPFGERNIQTDLCYDIHTFGPILMQRTVADFYECKFPLSNPGKDSP